MTLLPLARAMIEWKTPVLVDEGLLILYRLHPFDRLFQLVEILLGAVQCRFRGKCRLDHLARLQHRKERHVVKAQEDRKPMRQDIDAGLLHHDAAAGTRPQLEDALRFKNSETFAQRRTADVEQLQQVSLGAKAASGSEASRDDPVEQLLSHMLGFALRHCRRDGVHRFQTYRENLGGRFSAKAARPSA